MNHQVSARRHLHTNTKSDGESHLMPFRLPAIVCRYIQRMWQWKERETCVNICFVRESMVRLLPNVCDLKI